MGYLGVLLLVWGHTNLQSCMGNVSVLRNLADTNQLMMGGQKAQPDDRWVCNSVDLTADGHAIIRSMAQHNATDRPTIL